MTIPRVNHPWKLLKRELEARGRSQKAFAELIWKTTAEVNDLISGKRNITMDWALRLESALGMEYTIWMGIQNKRDWVQILKQQEKVDFFSRIKEKSGSLVFA